MSEMSELLAAMPLHYTPRRSFNLLTMILIKNCFVLYHLLVCFTAYNIFPPSLLLFQFPQILRKFKRGAVKQKPKLMMVGIYIYIYVCVYI
jgi:hypothetical protein